MVKVIHRNIKRQCTLKPLRVEIKCAKKRGNDGKGVRKASISLLHDMFILHQLFFCTQRKTCSVSVTPPPFTQSISSCFLCFLLWQSHGDLIFRAALQRFSVFLLRSHTLQDFKVVRVPSIFPCSSQICSPSPINKLSAIS